MTPFPQLQPPGHSVATSSPLSTLLDILRQKPTLPRRQESWSFYRCWNCSAMKTLKRANTARSWLPPFSNQLFHQKSAAECMGRAFPIHIQSLTIVLSIRESVPQARDQHH
jgi:hypothetical protein